MDKIAIMNATVVLPKNFMVQAKADNFPVVFSAAVQRAMQNAAHSFQEGLFADLEMQNLSKELADIVKKAVGKDVDFVPEQLQNIIPQEFNERSLKSSVNFVSKLIVECVARTIGSTNRMYEDAVFRIVFSYMSKVVAPTATLQFVRDSLLVMAKDKFEEGDLAHSLKIDFMATNLPTVVERFMTLLSQRSIRDVLTSCSLDLNKLVNPTDKRASAIANSVGGIFGVAIACYSGMFPSFSASNS